MEALVIGQGRNRQCRPYIDDLSDRLEDDRGAGRQRPASMNRASFDLASTPSRAPFIPVRDTCPDA
jgi:hypothetical protein